MSETNQKKEASSAKMSKGNKIALAVSAVGAVIIIALVLVIIVLLRKPDPVVAENKSAKGTVATPENIDEISESTVADGYYEVNMNNDWVFQTAKTPSDNAYVKNKESNRRTVYFDIILSDSNEVVYSSPYIPVGSSISDFALDVDVKAGEYSAIVRYHLVDDDYNELTTVSVSVTLTILA